MIALVAANLYVIFFNMSWGPVMWVMLGEMFPNQMRGSALAVAGFAQWFANYLIVQSFPIMAAWSLTGTYLFYTICAVISFFLVQTLHPRDQGQGTRGDGRLDASGCGSAACRTPSRSRHNHWEQLVSTTAAEDLSQPAARQRIQPGHCRIVARDDLRMVRFLSLRPAGDDPVRPVLLGRERDDGLHPRSRRLCGRIRGPAVRGYRLRSHRRPRRAEEHLPCHHGDHGVLDLRCGPACPATPRQAFWRPFCW